MDKKEVAVEIGSITATGSSSSGLTIPRDILDSVGWDRSTKVKIVEMSDGTVVISKLDL